MFLNVYVCPCVLVSRPPTAGMCVCVFVSLIHSASVSRVGFGQQVRTLPRAYLIQLGQAYFGNKCVICPVTHTDRPNVLSVDVDVLFFCFFYLLCLCFLLFLFLFLSLSFSFN